MDEIKELTAEDFLQKDSDPALMPYDISSKGRVWIRKVSNLEFKQWAARNKDGNDDLYNDGALIQLCICKKDGSRMFKLDHITQIVSQFQDIIWPLTKACMDFNGIGIEAQKKIAKNSQQTPGEDLLSDSEAGTS